MKKALFITFDFPPWRTSAVYRLAGLTRHQSEFGWQPDVLTAELKTGIQDLSLLEKIPPDIRVTRTKYWNIAWWENPVAAKISGLGGLRPIRQTPRQSRTDRLIRLFGALIRSCLYFPDQTIGWVPFGLAKAIRLLRERKFDVIYTTSPPRSAPLIGLILSWLSGIPWVLEFMDPWYLSERPLRKRFERWLLRLLLVNADAINVMTHMHKDELIREFRVPEEKFNVVGNGFDEDDFAPNQHSEADILTPGYIHLTHFGSVYPRFYGRFFQALEELVQNQPEVKGRLRVNIVGFPDEDLHAYASREALRDIIRIHGFVSHQVAIQTMRASHCLLLFLGARDFSRLVVPGKTYEYLRVGRPIIAVAYEGALKKLIETGKAGWVVDPDDTRTMRELIYNFVRKGLDQGSAQPPSPEFVAQFRWDALAGKLAGVFDKVTGSGR